MERRQVVLIIEALQIAEGKASYIGVRGVAVREVFEVLGNAPRFFVRQNRETGNEEYSMLGQTNDGRFLTVAIEEVDSSEGLWRLITAYPLNARRGQRLYDVKVTIMPRKPTDEEIDEEMRKAIEEGRELEGWEPVEVRVAKSPRAVYGLRLSPQEYEEIAAAAQARGMTMSDFLRSAARAAIEGQLDVEKAAALATIREKTRELTEAVSRL